MIQLAVDLLCFQIIEIQLGLFAFVFESSIKLRETVCDLLYIFARKAMELGYGCQCVLHLTLYFSDGIRQCCFLGSVLAAVPCIGEGQRKIVKLYFTNILICTVLPDLVLQNVTNRPVNVVSQLDCLLVGGTVGVEGDAFVISAVAVFDKRRVKSAVHIGSHFERLVQVGGEICRCIPFGDGELFKSLCRFLSGRLQGSHGITDSERQIIVVSRF
ncbi:SAM-dependent methyltransferase, putative [Babesia ovata]|uniref:SAM-dependent methyltransferase, putative n=1 Tax=Babesia ovata TaxID=189622 RepID=A0A2H6KKE8_9APIC|nr:SAM-dependent methyltransferase, putative [Babesia ovata]GBE63474.1 SAM-dependent methyltransferase, putative [Babesia ovata]